jgi:lipoate-protein ligase A
MGATDPTIACRLLVDPPAAGDRNMQVDDLLLDLAAHANSATLRFYRWSEPTLSLGYFQRHDDRRLHAASGQLPVVRRASGGGALVHHHELTYSVALPATHRLAAEPQQLYAVVHAVLANLINGLLPDSRNRALTCPEDYLPPTRDQPFLCYLRRTQGDLLIDRHGGTLSEVPRTLDGRFKVCGSAQRKRQGAVLQHGGILLNASPFAVELPGINDLVGSILTTDRLIDALSDALSRAIGLRLDAPCRWSSMDEIAEAVANESKFGSRSWVERR